MVMPSAVARVPFCPLRSLPPPPPRKTYTPQYDGKLKSVPPPAPRPAGSEVFCLENLQALRLNGALDALAGTQSRSTLLSVFTPATWDTLLYEVAVTPRERTVVHSQGDSRLSIRFNYSMCFPVPREPTQDGAVQLCFQVADITSGGRVRSTNRGCGIFTPGMLEYSILLSDGAQLALIVPDGGTG